MSIITHIGKTVRNHIGANKTMPRAADAPDAFTSEPLNDAASVTSFALAAFAAASPEKPKPRRRNGVVPAAGSDVIAAAEPSPAQTKVPRGARASEINIAPSNVSTGKVSKATVVLDLLKRETGATIAEIMEATQWQAHSVRGFLSGTVHKRLGLPLISHRDEGGRRVYRIGVGEGEREQRPETSASDDASPGRTSNPAGSIDGTLVSPPPFSALPQSLPDPEQKLSPEVAPLIVEEDK
jgi:hypothetical protein